MIDKEQVTQNKWSRNTPKHKQHEHHKTSGLTQIFLTSFQVKMELYREDCMMAWLIFDGRRTTWLDWFGQYKLLDSSFEDLKENKEFEFFSMV